MVRFLISAAVFLATAALGLWVASLVLADVTLTLSGFLIAVGVFALAQSILTPFIVNMARKHAPRLLGGVGIVSTLVALWVATLFPDGLQIHGLTTWILAALIVWIVTAVGGWILAALFLKRRAGGKAGASPA